MNWDDLDDATRRIMRELGEFGPTGNEEDKEVKGLAVTEDGEVVKMYYRSIDLRAIAEACIEVADWLDERGYAAQRLS
jgi:hypothetical protein